MNERKAKVKLFREYFVNVSEKLTYNVTVSVD